MEGTNKAHENGEAMGFVGVRLTVMLGRGCWFGMLHSMCEITPYDLLSTHIFENCLPSSVIRRSFRSMT